MFTFVWAYLCIFTLELDGLKEGEGFVELWEVICKSLDGVVGDLVGFACGGEVRAKEKVGYG